MRVAHISDLHVLAMDGVGAARFVNKRFTGLLNLKLKREHAHKRAHLAALLEAIRGGAFDHVIVTGDLTNLALESEFEAVRAMLDAGLGMPSSAITVVPGNHDLYTRGAMKTRRFTSYFEPFIKSDLPELSRNMDLGPFPFVRLRGPLAIVGLTTAVPRPPLVAAGVVGAEQREALSIILDHPEVKKRGLVLCMHHPLHPPARPHKALMEGLHDAHLMRSLLSNTRGLVLHGHLHRRMQTPIEGSPITSVGATSASLEHTDPHRMAGFNVYDFDRTTGALTSMSAEVLMSDGKSTENRAIPVAHWH